MSEKQKLTITVEVFADEDFAPELVNAQVSDAVVKRFDELNARDKRNRLLIGGVNWRS